MTRAFWLAACLALVAGCQEEHAPAAPPAASATSRGSAATSTDPVSSKAPRVADPHFRELLVAIRPHDFEMVGGGQRIGRHDYDCTRNPIMN